MRPHAFVINFDRSLSALRGAALSDNRWDSLAASVDIGVRFHSDLNASTKAKNAWNQKVTVDYKELHIWVKLHQPCFFFIWWNQVCLWTFWMTYNALWCMLNYCTLSACFGTQISLFGHSIETWSISSFTLWNNLIQ